ncbi:sensor histidine kinase [Gorillibacterium sp. sgz5001074]|uniref:sensor histidine kinase n=1 Tax=Gorillibacterium sp. sgz5001074 TaxID=3446695 RepID=UPI003F67098C
MLSVPIIMYAASYALFSKSTSSSTLGVGPLPPHPTNGPSILHIAGILLLLATLAATLIFLSVSLMKANRMNRELTARQAELMKLNKRYSMAKRKLESQFDKLRQTQMNLTASEEKYRLLFDRMLNGFVIAEPIFGDGGELVDVRFISANPAVIKQSGPDTPDLTGMTFSQAFPQEELHLDIYRRLLESDGPLCFELHETSKDNYYVVHAFKISDNLYGAMFENITRYKRAEGEIRRLNQDLEAQVDERTRELQEALKELEAFTYAVSHDLKAPLRAIEGYTTILQEDYGASMETDAREMMLHIRRSCGDMIGLIDRLLQYSTAARAELCMEPTDLGGMFDSVFRELSLLYPNRRIRFQLDSGMPVVYGDKMMLRAVVVNLLSNALKYTQYRLQTVIEVGYRQSEGEIIFFVRDNGVGFDPKEADQLFSLFRRLHSPVEFEGHGIGLVTVKAILQKHGGRVWIEGARDAGATVYFTVSGTVAEANPKMTAGGQYA